jgi:hypothetical protein
MTESRLNILGQVYFLVGLLLLFGVWITPEPVPLWWTGIIGPCIVFFSLKLWEDLHHEVTGELQGKTGKLRTAIITLDVVCGLFLLLEPWVAFGVLALLAPIKIGTFLIMAIIIIKGHFFALWLLNWLVKRFSPQPVTNAAPIEPLAQ